MATGTIAERAPAATGTVLLLLTVAMVVLAWWEPVGINWIIVLLIIALFFLVTGKAITGRALGILINERNLMSLARLQLVIWTAIIVSAFFVIAIARIKSADVAQPLAIGIDWKIWTLLGISTASFVGTPLLNANKANKEPKAAPAVLQKTANRFQEPAAVVDQNRQGILYGNSAIADARFTDMFEGDELSNTHLVDVGKLQMFFFTIVVAIAYAAQLFQLIAYGDLDMANVKLPEVNDGLLALMGVSNAAYLAGKGVDQTPTA